MTHEVCNPGEQQGVLSRLKDHFAEIYLAQPLRRDDARSNGRRDVRLVQTYAANMWLDDKVLPGYAQWDDWRASVADRHDVLIIELNDFQD